MSTTEPTQRQFLALAIPNTLAALAVPLAELVSIGFLGRDPDTTQLSGVILATIIFDFLFWGFAFLRMGTTGLVAQAYGAHDQQEQASLFWRGMLLALFFGVALIALQQPIAWLSFGLLAGGPEVHQAAKDFYYWHIWGAVPTLVNYVCIGWLLGRHRSRDVVIISLIWQSVNVVLDYILIIDLEMGANGAGIAIMVAEWVGMAACLYFVWRDWGSVPEFNRASILNWPRLRKLMSLNGAILLRTLMLISVIAAFTNISATFGTVVLAANAILLRLFVTCAYVVDGFALALEALAGRYYGAGEEPALRRAYWLTLRWNLALASGFILLFGALAEPILGFINTQPSVVETGVRYMPWLLGVILAGSIAFTLDGFFLGQANAGLLFRSMALSAATFVPLATYAAYIHSLPVLWFAYLVFTTMRAITLWLKLPGFVTARR
jgi:multidrug resistance protein, MATE family